MSTIEQYRNVIMQCQDVFLKKTFDYGTAWRVLRPISIIDQIYIKAWRIRTIQEEGDQLVNDSIEGEFIGIINYSIIGLMQMGMRDEDDEELSVDTVKPLYEKAVSEAITLMQRKNHDYGEAWRKLSQQSLVDLILMKLQRMKQILANKGKLLISEGLDANYYDMLNYAVFALILCDESKVAA